MHGRPVAELQRVTRHRRAAVPKTELLALLDRQRPDPPLAADLAWITQGDTDDLGDLR